MEMKMKNFGSLEESQGSAGVMWVSNSGMSRAGDCTPEGRSVDFRLRIHN